MVPLHRMPRTGQLSAHGVHHRLRRLTTSTCVVYDTIVPVQSSTPTTIAVPKLEAYLSVNETMKPWEYCLGCGPSLQHLHETGFGLYAEYIGDSPSLWQNCTVTSWCHIIYRALTRLSSSSHSPSVLAAAIHLTRRLPIAGQIR